jgi:hypothetical protein
MPSSNFTLLSVAWLQFNFVGKTPKQQRETFEKYLQKASRDALIHLSPNVYSEGSNSFLHAWIEALFSSSLYKHITMSLIAVMTMHIINVYYGIGALKILNSEKKTALELLLSSLRGEIANKEINKGFLLIIMEFCKLDCRSNQITIAQSEFSPFYYLYYQDTYALLHSLKSKEPIPIKGFHFCIELAKHNIASELFISVPPEQKTLLTQYARLVKIQITDMYAYYAAIYMGSGTSNEEDNLVRLRYLTGAYGLRPIRIRLVQYLVPKRNRISPGNFSDAFRMIENFDV